MNTFNDNEIDAVVRGLTADGVAPRIDATYLHTFLDELFRWNPRVGLVSKQDPVRVVTGLIRQSVRFWDFVLLHSGVDPGGKRHRAADIGTGGGFPGLVWALLEPRLEMTLIERKIRKTAFLERVAAKTRPVGLEVIGMDLDAVARQSTYRRVFDLVATMAVGPPDPIADALDAILAADGVYCTMQSSGDAPPPAKIGRVLRRRATEAVTGGRFVMYERMT